ncbi:MAG: hypothetical protein WC319_05730 [Candidatus Paceibacterota bacterium]|jgi:metal-responsive CopG/Arc/MetJ family transcriptional regulator
MKTTTKRISALLPSFLVDEVKRTSEIEKKTQSEIIKGALEEWSKKKLIDDLEELSKIDFDDVPTINEWVSIRPHIN